LGFFVVFAKKSQLATPIGAVVGNEGFFVLFFFVFT
jgi:hypothetical protein